ncbi:hypothetical protein ACIBG8_03975 [Nonomuraea sp. NPDC050556]|uniref:hypothetical protein n=1 Tax=Nonomuraea sp. NPDC050556 TaxID=3364369 RepID=UPI00379507CF
MGVFTTENGGVGTKAWATGKADKGFNALAELIDDPTTAQGQYPSSAACYEMVMGLLERYGERRGCFFTTVTYG